MEVFMREALVEANKALEIDEVPIGAIIVKDNIIISRTFNGKEHSQISTHHAEILAIEQACQVLGSWRLEDCDLYCTLEPCSMCAGAIIQARISRVIFGARDKKSGALGGLYDMYQINGFNHYPRVIGSILEEECSKLLTNYFKTKR